MRVEAGVIPEPRHGVAEVYRQCLARNRSTRSVHFSLEPDGEVVLTGAIPVESVSEESLELVLGEVWELVEVSFRPLIRAGFGRENKG